MASSDKVPESWVSALGKSLFSLLGKAVSGSKHPETLIDISKPAPNATNEEMAYKDEIDELKARLSSAEYQRTQAKLDMVDLEEAFTRSKQMFTALHQEANSVHVSLNQYERAYKDEESRASKFQEENETLKRSLAEYSTTVENLKAQSRSILKSSQQEKAVLEYHLAEQGSEYDLLNEQVRAAQNLSFQQIESPYWMPQATKDTSGDLSQIQKKLKRWCEEWVNLEIFEGALSNTEKRARLLKTIQHFVCLEDNLLPRNLSITITSAKVATMLLSGLVSQLVFKSLFDQPFWRGVNRRSKALSDVFLSFKDRDEVSAENWRTQTLRLLNPSINHRKRKFEVSSHTEADPNKYIAEVAGRLAESTISVASGLFISDHFTETACRDLDKIITPAVELACKLWCQKTSMQVADLSRLPEVLADSDGPFSACTEYLEEHALHRRELAADEYALDYKSIAVVVSPAVLAYGDHDGTDFSNDTRHVLKKAVVWME